MRHTTHSDPRHGACRHLVLCVVVCVALAVTLALAAGACGSGGAEPSPSPADETVTVPDLAGDHVSQDAATLEIENAGLVAVVETEASSEVPAGGVVRQSPDAGQKVEKGSQVVISVSLGPEMVGLPDLKGMKKKEVVAFLDAHRLRGDEVEGQTTKVDVGRCFKQRPGPGDHVPEGSTVTYWISSGKPTVKVPDLTGMTPERARDELSQKSLVYGGSEKKYSSTVQKGLVLGQSVPAGTSVARGTDVAVYVSKGPHSTTLTVPDLIGRQQKAAVNELRQKGFQSILVDRVASSEPAGRVIKQSPTAGKRIHPTEQVVLKVSKGAGTLLKVPDCVGMDATDAVDRLQLDGFTNVQTKKTASSRPERKVVEQAPRAGSKIHPTDPIVLFVSEGLDD